MNEDFIKIGQFDAKDGSGISFAIPFIQTSEVDLIEGSGILLSEESQKVLECNYKVLAESGLRRNGATIIFGTFDSLHAGHVNMLKTAKAFGEELYVGIEGLEKAIFRKQGKHTIQSAYDRRNNIVKIGITDSNKVFVRERVLNEIKSLRSRGINITTLAVGEFQSYNPEIIEAVQWCLDNEIQVIAINRLRTRNEVREISSTAIRKMGQCSG